MPRILLIDDDDLLRAIARETLARAGHETLEAAEGQAGLELARTHHPDLIVCDVLMPGLNGYQFVSALRAEEGIAGIPVIMLTSMAERTHMRLGMISGADDYLVKPVRADELTEAVNALLTKRRMLQDGLIDAMNTSFVTALEEQREALAAQYERRLVDELGARWDEPAGEAESKYEHAVVLRAHIAGALQQRALLTKEASARMRRAYELARDALYLFSPVDLLPAGADLVAIYVDPPDSARVRASMRAVRAAMALVRGLASLRADGDKAPPVNVALHCGPLVVLRMNDPLHGGPEVVVPTGRTMQEIGDVAEFVRGSQWNIAASAAFVGEMAGQLVTGRDGQAGSEKIDVVEVLSVR